MVDIRAPTVHRRHMRSLRVLLPCIVLTYLTFFYKTSSVQFPEIISIQQSCAPATVTLTQASQATMAITPPQANLRRPIEPHSFRSDGLLEVNPKGRHPIYDLIERAQADWDQRIKRQSKTLVEAVAEYKRRYRRAPPKGFDHWWSYCMRHNVQLPDEYDRIYDDLEPFWGMHPLDLNKLRTEIESERDSYTLGKTKNSEVTMVASALPEPGPDSPTKNYIAQAKEFADLLNQVSEFIPPFRAVFSPHDNPSRTTDWEVRTQALEAAAAGTYVDINNPPPVKYSGWPSGCSPESPLRRTTFNIDVPPPPPPNKTFIYDHLKAMDPCYHPSLLHHHGQFVSHHEGPIPRQIMIPQFSHCSTAMHHDIALALNWVDDDSDDQELNFHDRPEERLSWRGTTTGIWHAEDTRWRSSQRIRLVKWAHEQNGTAAVLGAPATRDERVGAGRAVARARLNPAMLDVAFAGKPHSCVDGVCEVMAREFEFRDYQSVEAVRKYKYVLDIDGNGWSSRFKRLMSSNSVVFKTTVYPEWFSERLQPWVHFVPVQLDLSDLYDSLTFFRGDLYGDGAHEELAARIALAGQKWTKAFWRNEDITAYMFRLFLEYARVMSIDREGMSYVL